MKDPADDIAQQARQGSVAAIVQVLNDRLAEVGVRTRAVLDRGILQLLCESPSADNLERSSLVERVRSILEELAPRNIRRAKINSRITREQQLLWFDEIRRDPDNQLLWSEQIAVRRPNLLRRLFGPRSAKKRIVPLPKKLPVSSPLRPKNHQFWVGILGGVGLTLLVLLGGWWALQRTNAVSDRLPSLRTTPEEMEKADPFAEAVRTAEEASMAGQTAQTRAQWLDLAAQWQRAANLMEKVPEDHQGYEIARDRAVVYRRNSEIARDRAEAMRQQLSP